MSDDEMSPRDLDILRRLVGGKMEIAEDPVNLERKEAWYKYDARPRPTSPCC